MHADREEMGFDLEEFRRMMLEHEQINGGKVFIPMTMTALDVFGLLDAESGPTLRETLDETWPQW